MVGPSAKRRAVDHLISDYGFSERKACRLLGLPRSTHRYKPRRRNDEQALLDRMTEIARQHPNHGYRRVCRLLREQGWLVNPKRVYRLWRLHDLGQSRSKIPHNLLSQGLERKTR
jgi:putative transposase